VDRDPLGTAVAIITVHAGRLTDPRGSAGSGDGLADPDGQGAPELVALEEAIARTPGPAPDLDDDDPEVADDRLILDLIGTDPTYEEIGELIVALGMLGSILAEEVGGATGRSACDVLRDLALRYAA
jgi:hypothetical protein